jgi:hypothetical protein
LKPWSLALFIFDGWKVLFIFSPWSIFVPKYLSFHMTSQYKFQYDFSQGKNPVFISPKNCTLWDPQNSRFSRINRNAKDHIIINLNKIKETFYVIENRMMGEIIIDQIPKKIFL